ncbi:hypothetical protein A0256_13300 [Mucilaginibacter sp. PAMC 26640]|nr:hypothetical protein A0256_13300 [Mucilaginibacter sp. PAMC 26640]
MTYSKDPSLLLEKRQELEVNGLIDKVLKLLVIPDNVGVALPEVQHTIKFSLIAFEQILMNLLNNTIRYNNKDIGLIQISFKDNSDFYELVVEDNGMGIPCASLDKIFDNNVTLNIKDRFGKQGSGIGLSTVKDLLYLLNSTINVKSTPGLGSTFLARLSK